MLVTLLEVVGLVALGVGLYLLGTGALLVALGLFCLALAVGLEVRHDRKVDA